VVVAPDLFTAYAACTQTGLTGTTPMSEPRHPRDEQPPASGHRASGGNDALNADDTHVARGVDENTRVEGPEHDAKAVYQQPDGTPKATGRTLVESVATVRIDCTNAPNDRVMIHIEHPTTIEAPGASPDHQSRRRSHP